MAFRSLRPAAGMMSRYLGGICAPQTTFSAFGQQSRQRMMSTCGHQHHHQQQHVNERTTIAALAVFDNGGVVRKHTIQRRALGPNDIHIKITHCGICHSDIHHAYGDWKEEPFPIVPGHEIVGEVTAIGSNVTSFKIGQRAGVGCYTDSCRTCGSCESTLSHMCEGMHNTYSFIDPKTGEPAHGGYSQSIVVDADYALKIPDALRSDGAAPLLCAGVSVYSPFMHYGVKAGDTVGVVGLGGLGHMAVKILHAMGCKVVVMSTSPSKEEEARSLGADEFVITKGAVSANSMKAFSRKCDFIINTVSADQDVVPLLQMLKPCGTFILVGLPSKPLSIPPAALLKQKLKIGGSLIGSIKETQDMLDFCAKHNIHSDVEVIPASYVNKAFERVMKSDVRYRFVIDMATLSETSPEVEPSVAAAAAAAGTA